MTLGQQHRIGSGFDARSTAAQVLDGIDLTGKTVMIIGGYSGLGTAATEAMTRAGAHVVVPARRPDTPCSPPTSPPSACAPTPCTRAASAPRCNATSPAHNRSRRAGSAPTTDPPRASRPPPRAPPPRSGRPPRPRLAAHPGAYCQDCDIAEPATTDDMLIGGVKPWAVDPAAAAHLWALSCEFTGLDGLSGVAPTGSHSDAA